MSELRTRERVEELLERLEVPIVQAPMAGGASTPQLAAAVSDAGGLGCVAAGYLKPDGFREAIMRTRELTERPFAVNLFAPSGHPSDPHVVKRQAERLRPLADRVGVGLGEAHFSDDDFASKLAIALDAAPAVVSFTFGCPKGEVFEAVRAAGSEGWVTVTSVSEARQAVAQGADALIVQGSEAGGHRGCFRDDDDNEQIGLLALLQLVDSAVNVPLVAAGGIATGRAVAAVLAAGAEAAALGTAFMLCPEAGTSEPHRAMLGSSSPTGLTRAFTGRLARGIINDFQRDLSDAAPVAYPEVHYLTAPLRAHARASGDAQMINLWAGQAHPLARRRSVPELMAELVADAEMSAELLRARLRPRS